MDTNAIKESDKKCADFCKVSLAVVSKKLPTLKNPVMLPKNISVLKSKATAKKSMNLSKNLAAATPLRRRTNNRRGKKQTPMASLEMMLTTKEFQKIQQLPKLPTDKDEKRQLMEPVADSPLSATAIGLTAAPIINLPKPLPKCITVKPVNNWNAQVANLRKTVKEKLKEHVKCEVTLACITEETQTVSRGFETCGFVKRSNKSKTFSLTCFNCDAQFELSDWQQYMVHYNNGHKLDGKRKGTIRLPKLSTKTVTKRILMPQSTNSTETPTDNTSLAANDIISFPIEEYNNIDIELNPIFSEDLNNIDNDERVSVSSLENENSEPRNAAVIDFYKTDSARILRFLETLQDHPLLWHPRRHGPTIFDEEVQKFLQKFDTSMAAVDFYISIKNARDLLRRFSALSSSKKAKLENEPQLQQYIDLINDVAMLSKSYAYTCDICSYFFLEEKDLFKHKFKKHKIGGISYICSCGLHFADSKGKDAHEATHNTQPNFTCEYCGLLFFSQKRVQNHININHPDAVPYPQPYQCPKCDERFAKPYMLKWHKLKHDPPRYKCETCGKAYRKAFEFRRHIRGHLNQRDFVCEECGRGFIAKNQLKRHLFKVHKASEHVCSPCKTYFASYENMYEHMQKFHPNGTNLDRKKKQHAIHVKRYHDRLKANQNGSVRKRVDNLICKQCGIAFGNVGELRQHKRDLEHYLGDRRYKCPHCESILSSDQTFVIHLRRIHHLQAKYSDVKYFQPYTGDSQENIEIMTEDADANIQYVDNYEEVKYAVDNLNYDSDDETETFATTSVANYEEVQYCIPSEEEKSEYIHEYQTDF